MIMKTQQNYWSYFIAFFLGALLPFAFAPYEIFPLAIIAPAGLLLLWLNASPRRAFRLGFLFGLGLFGVGVYWVYISIHVFSDMSNFLAAFITAGFICILALCPAVVGYILNRYFPTQNTTKITCAFPAIWVVSEWVRSWLFTGFPWLFLGYSQTGTPLSGYAPLFSVYGVSLAVLLSSAFLVNAILALKQKNYKSGYQNLFALVMIWMVASLFSLIPWTKTQGRPIDVSLVQGNIPQSIKWSPEHLQLSLDTYENLTSPLWAKDKLIIWPEAAIPMTLQNAENYINALDQKARENNSHLLLGIPIEDINGKGFYNAIVSLGQDKVVYLKRRLVPFGEYTPFAKFLSKLFNYLNIPTADILPGNIQQKPLIIGQTKILPTICYEIAFPEMLKTQDKTIGLILTVTNDAWFGKSSAQAQHLQMAKMRAIEFGRPVLFVSNDGITAIINANGQIKAAAPAYQAFVLNGQVQPTYGLTPWMRNGMDPILFILICLLAAAIRHRKAANRDKVTHRALLPEIQPNNKTE